MNSELHAFAESVRFRVYTEAGKGFTCAIIEAAERHFPEGFNFCPTSGHWAGGHETSCVVEVIGTQADARDVEAMAHEIRTANSQEEVWITAEPVSLRKVIGAGNGQSEVIGDRFGNYLDQLCAADETLTALREGLA